MPSYYYTKFQKNPCVGRNERCPLAVETNLLVYFSISPFLNIYFVKHYENTPIQIYRKFHHQKTENFQIKILIFFHISAQNIDCGYSLEPPEAVLTSTHNLCF